jgi:hypothetical protein
MCIAEEDDVDESKAKPASVGPEWDDLHSTIPVVKYIMCGHVTWDSLKNCPSGDVDNDGDNDGGQDTGDAPAVQKRTSSRQAEEDARWKESREAEITKLQDHFYRVKSKLRSCKREEFSQRAARVDGHLLAAFQELSDVQDIADTTVAHRYRDDPKRQQRPPPKRATPAATGGGPAYPPPMYKCQRTQ